MGLLRSFEKEAQDDAGNGERVAGNGNRKLLVIFVRTAEFLLRRDFTHPATLLQFQRSCSAGNESSQCCNYFTAFRMANRVIMNFIL